MVTKKVAAKKTAAKKPTPVQQAKAKLAKAQVKAAQAFTKLKEIDAPAVESIFAPSDIKELEKVEAKIQKAAVKKSSPVEKVQIEVHGVSGNKPTKRTVKLNKAQSKAFHDAKTPKEQALIAASATIKNPERVRRSAQVIEKAAANIKAKVNEVVSQAAKPSTHHQLEKKASLVAPGHQSQTSQKASTVSPTQSVSDIWSRNAPSDQKSYQEKMTEMLRVPVVDNVSSGSFFDINSKPSKPPEVEKVLYTPPKGAMSVNDMNAAIASRQQPANPGVDIKSFPFKTR